MLLEIDGKAADFEPGMSFDGPVLQARFGGNSVHVHVPGQEHTLSF